MQPERNQVADTPDVRPAVEGGPPATSPEERGYYYYDELSPKAQERARNWWTDGAYQIWDSAPVISYWQEELSNHGYMNATIAFAGFGSQGDGACFDAEIDTPFFLRKFKAPKIIREAYNHDLFVIEITGHNYHYFHEHTRKVERNDYNDIYDELLEIKGGDNDFRRICFEALHKGSREVEEKVNAFIERIENDRVSWCRKIYKALEEDFFSNLEDDVVVDILRVNEYEFDEDGDRIVIKRKRKLP